MGGRGRMVAALLAALLAGGAMGGYAGFRLGTDAVVSLWVTTNAGHTEDVVAILEHMRGVPGTAEFLGRYTDLSTGAKILRKLYGTRQGRIAYNVPGIRPEFAH